MSRLRHALALLLLGLPAGMAQAQAPDPAAAPIATLNQGLMTAEKTASQKFAVRYAALAPAVDAAFDLRQILQTIVGLPWSGVSEADRTRLLATFRAYTIANYVANFNSDSGDHIRILPETRSVGADRVVETEIVPTRGDSVRLDYVMRQGPAGWRAVDVLEEKTISQVATQRSDFRALVAQGAPALVASLQAKVDMLSGNSVKP